MRKLGTLIASATLVLGLAGAVHATTTLTTAVLGAADGSRLLCVVTNFDKKPATLTIEILDPFTSSQLALFNCNGPVAAGGACFANSANTGFKNGFCKITSSTSRLKAVLWVQDGPGNVLTALPASK